MNDSDREQWVGNDEALYLWFATSGEATEAQFVRKYRKELTEYIEKKLKEGSGPETPKKVYYGTHEGRL